MGGIIVVDFIDMQSSANRKVLYDKLKGEIAFTLYDTFGFPLDLTEDALRVRGISVDTMAFNAAMRLAKQGGSLAPPKIILNAPTKLMANEGYGRGYVYDPDTPEGFSGQDYFPEELGRQSFYRPTRFGAEAEIAKRLAYWDKLRKAGQD